mgnify:CR=1 FL=1
MKRCYLSLICLLGLMLTLSGCGRNTSTGTADTTVESPEWAASIGEENGASQIFIVAAVGDTTAYVSMHEKNEDGEWTEIISTPGFIGKYGMDKEKEGDAKTPTGSFHFTEAFGIAPDPGCNGFTYKQVTDDDYWSGDMREGYSYNKMVNIKDLPDLDVDASEHIIDYTEPYQYCMNISYNEDGEAGLGSAIFLHCFKKDKPYTGGCVAIPQDKMITVVQRVKPECVVILDTLGELSPALYSEWDPAGRLSENSNETSGESTEKEPESMLLPAYTYTGDEKTAAICDYLVNVKASDYEKADVSIPYMYIVDEDVDTDDIRIWGDFWILNYNLDGEVLKTESGGNYPGLMHLEKISGGGYSVVDFEVVADGSDFIPSAKKIFGDRYDDFARAHADNEAMEKLRLEYIRDYVKANELDITAYQDYGWDAVSID